jgi:hypothetical protein
MQSLRAQPQHPDLFRGQLHLCIPIFWYSLSRLEHHDKARPPRRKGFYFDPGKSRTMKVFLDLSFFVGICLPPCSGYPAGD